MTKQLIISIRATIVLLIIVSGVYPAVIWGVGQGLFNYQANGSLVKQNGQVIGSELLAQSFAKPQYFQPRPSAAGSGYDPTESGGTNLGPTSNKLINGIHLPPVKGQPNPGDFDGVKDLAAEYRTTNLLPANAPVPVDAVTRSASGLDPDISIPNADDQAARIAQSRGVDVSKIMALIDSNTEHPALGFLGPDRVNVLDINLALDKQYPMPAGK